MSFIVACNEVTDWFTSMSSLTEPSTENICYGITESEIFKPNETSKSKWSSEETKQKFDTN